jgi:hypothetical protein
MRANHMNRRVRATTTTSARRPSVGYQTLGRWLIRLARLDLSVFDEIRAEPTATSGAIAIVLCASLTAGMGSWLWAMQHDDLDLDTASVFLKTVLAGGLIQTGVWMLWVYLTYTVLTRVMAAQVEYPELARTMGLAFAPLFLSLLVALSPLAVPFGVLSLAMALLFSNVAVEVATGVSPREATIANLAGFAPFLALMGFSANVFEENGIGGLAPGLLFFALDFN